METLDAVKLLASKEKNQEKKYQIKVNGILHIGAHDCEELDSYVKGGCPKDKIIWIEANPEKVDILKKRDKQFLIKKGEPNTYSFLSKLNDAIESDNDSIKPRRKMLIKARKKYLDNFEKRKPPLLKYDKEIRGNKVVYVYKGKINILPKFKEFILNSSEAKELGPRKTNPQMRNVQVGYMPGGQAKLFRTKEEANKYYF